MDLNNLFNVAVEEMENTQFEEAEKHFDMIVMEDGSNIDAKFLRAYCKCRTGTLGDISNQAVLFTNAFCRYVDELEKLEDFDLRTEKMNEAVKKLSELTSFFSSNAKRTMFTAPSIGIEINSATKRMTDTCTAKIKASPIFVSTSTLVESANATKENKNSLKILFIILGIGVGVWILWEIIDWMIILS